MIEPEDICCVCHKPVRPGHWMINLDNQTAQFIAPDAAPAHGEWGCLPIGKDCAKNLVKSGQVPADWIIKQ